MNKELADSVVKLIQSYDSDDPGATAVQLQQLWLSYEPVSTAGIKAEQRAQQKTVGIPVPVLRTIGKEVGKTARKQVDDFVPLMQLLWDEYGREGRVVALIPLGAMELAAPGRIVPLLREMCRSCITWEDADRLAMDALEPIVRKQPDNWLPAVEAWLDDENKWVRRAGVIVIGRLPMKQAAYTSHCLAQAERLLLNTDTDVKKATSFAIRLCARGDVVVVSEWLAQQVPPTDLAATWVLCDVIRSMATKLLPALRPLLPRYELWAADPALSSRDRRSVESAVKKLRQIE